MIWLLTGILLAMYSYICWRSVRNGLLVLIGALPLYLIKLNFFSIPTTMLELMIGVVFVFWVTRELGNTRKPSTSLRAAAKQPFRLSSVSNNRFDLALLGTVLLVIGAILGLSQTSDLASSLNAMKSFLIEPILVGAMIFSVESRSKKIKLNDWMFALAVPMSILSLYAIFQWFTGFGIPDAWFLERRVTSFFPYPNALGHFVAPIVTLMIVWFMQRGVRRLGVRDIVLLSTIPLGLIALFLSQTEAAWVAITATVVIAGIVINKHRKAWIAIALLGALFAVAVPQARHKLMLNDWSGQTRTAQWEETENFLSNSHQNFFLGAGPNNYPTAIAPYHTHEHLEIFQQPHNIFLNIWVEYGLLGLTGFLILTSAIFSTSLRTGVKQPFRLSDVGNIGSTSNPATLAITAALLEMSIHGLVDVPYFKNDLSVLIWALVALMLLSSYDTNQCTESPTCFTGR
ncbi:hypothetical protein HOI83_00315 [Candidatus Uhrbacteria bacterium]|jgi:O-antigen ligase|nr:hypothetical protein [Candidatus Uhrbacteria bacterium]